MECHTARLIYTPNQSGKERRWVREHIDTAKVETSNDHKKIQYYDTTKYFESKQGEKFILFISTINLTDSGGYLVFNGERFIGRSRLTVIGNSSKVGIS
jgi:uncharacterized protein YxeA